MYRLIQCKTVVADDSNLNQVTFSRSCSIYQMSDLEASTATLRIVPGADELQVDLGALTQGYAVSLYADYPVRVRFNDAAGTQMEMTRGTVQPVNNGAPLPAQCCVVASWKVSSIYLEPLANASQTASVWLCVTGDPDNAY